MDNSEGDVNLTRRRDAWRHDHISAETGRLLEEDAEYFLHQSLSTPCLNVLEACDGATLRDRDGRSILDFHGNGVHQVGYGHPAVIEAVVAQMQTLPFCPRRYTNQRAVDLARTLAARAPAGLSKVLFAPSGAVAVGTALKLARVATGRHKTVSWWDSFHGATLDTISIGGEAHFRSGVGPLLPGTIHVPPPSTYRSAFGRSPANPLESAEYVEYVMAREGDVAAFIAEPIRSAGVIIPPKEYWRRIREICDRHGALLILDEIPLCLGRTGAFFACEHFGVNPDMVCIGKGLGGGVFPMAALMARKTLDRAGDRSLGHYTHEKSPVGAAAALAVIRVIEEEGLLERVKGLGQKTLEELDGFKDRHRLVGDVRGIGLLFGVELVKNRETKEPAAEEAEAVMYEALAGGLSFKISMGNVLTLAPPLTITDAEMSKALGILDESITRIERSLGMDGGSKV